MTPCRSSRVIAAAISTSFRSGRDARIAYGLAHRVVVQRLPCGPDIAARQCADFVPAERAAA